MNTSGSGSGTQNNAVLIVWAKTYDDASSFPTWANAIPSTLVDFYKVMSYNQHIITTKVATKNGGFYVSDPGHTVSYYKNQYQSGQGYLGPWGIFVEEILGKVEADKGAAYFDDVDLIMMMVTDGGGGWYQPNINATGIGWLGVDYTTGNNKTFNRYTGGITSEFSIGESDTKWTVCHEYGHFLGFTHRDSTYGTYSLMYRRKLNEAGETVTPLCIQNIIAEGWLNVNDPNRVKNVSSNTTNFTLRPVRNTTGIVAVKVDISATEYFIINNHQQSTNPYDGTYPASGLLIWHITGSDGDVEAAVALDPNTYGINFDHLDLSTSDPNYHGEGLATDFWNLTNRDTFAPWTNPNTATQSGSFTDISVIVKSQTGNDLAIDVLINSPPAAPQNLVIANAGQNGQNVILAWDANAEPDLNHYAIYRGYQDSKTSPINWLTNPVATTTNTTWTDPFVKINTSAQSSVHYRITAVDDANNESDYSNSVSTNSYQVPKISTEPVTGTTLTIPQKIALHQNYPNPFNPRTEIKFDLPKDAYVILKIYNILGEEIRTLVDRNMEMGFHSVTWDGKDEAGKDLPTGIHIYRFQVSSGQVGGLSFVAVKKLTLLCR